MRQRNRKFKNRNIMRHKSIVDSELARIDEAACYVGKEDHKKHPADYGFETPPRPKASRCDRHRIVKWKEAIALLRTGIKYGMVSTKRKNDMPNQIWAMDADGVAYEAVQGGMLNGRRTYHGYALDGSDSNMRRKVVAEWARRT